MCSEKWKIEKLKEGQFMSRQKAILLGVLLLGCLSMTGIGYTATINANSCSPSDVSNAIARAGTGDTVFVPSGSCSWTSGITFSKAITIRGAGEATAITASGDSLFTINASGSGNYRISNMKFLGKSSSGTDVNINGVWSSMRIDNIKWNTGSTRGITIGYSHAWDIVFSGASIPHQKVLIDNINYSVTAGGTPFILIYGRNQLAWQEDDGFGTDNFVFIEDSTFNWATMVGYVIDTEFSGRFVFRHNNVFNGGVYMHDLGSTPRSRGNRAAEVYENRFTCNISACSNNSVALNNTRGGTGIFFNNAATGFSLPTWNMIYRVAFNNSFIGGGYCTDTGTRKVCQDMTRRCNGGTRDNRPCYSDGDCPGSTCGDYACASNSDCKDYFGNNGLCLQLDGSSENGWPCRDQSGRGKDNPTTGVQESSPIYWYNNTVNGVSNAPMRVSGQYAAYIQENRDYCNHSPATACGSKAGWAYTPYTYPHPLSGDATLIIHAPTGLKILN
jgi:hypothetical protein